MSTTPEQEEIARKAHEATLHLIEKHVKRVEDPVSQRMVLNGVMGGVAQIAWQTRQPGATVESLTESVKQIVHGLLQQMADDDSAGLKAKMH